MSRQTIALDLDGTLARYDGWSNEIGDPLPGALAFVRSLQNRGFTVIIQTARRPLEDVRAWVARNGLRNVAVTGEKTPASAYLDDRAVRFDGDYNKALQEILTLRPWWKTS